MLRLKKLREAKGLSQAELAKIIGISASSIGMYEQGRRTPEVETLKKIANYFNVPTDYLIFSTENTIPSDLKQNPLYASHFDITNLSNYIGPVVENKKIPIIGSVKCGPNGLAFEYLEGYVLIDDSFTGNIVAFRCKGNSMSGIGINEGDIAIVRQQEDVENGELAIVIVNGDEGTLKRVRKFDGGIALEAANPEYESRIFTGDSLETVKIMGKVLEIRRRF